MYYSEHETIAQRNRRRRSRIFWTILLGSLLFLTLLYFASKKPEVAKKMEAHKAVAPMEAVEVDIKEAEIPADQIQNLIGHLQSAYDREFGASVRYETWAEKAKKDGWNGVAALFQSLAKSEKVQADRNAEALKVLGAAPLANVSVPEVGTVEEMLKKASESETDIIGVFYPLIIEQVKKIPQATALVTMLQGALASDVEHEKIFASIMKDPKAWNDEDRVISVCSVCGHIEQGEPPQNCPVCGSPKEKFSRTPITGTAKK